MPRRGGERRVSAKDRVIEAGLRESLPIENSFGQGCRVVTEVSAIATSAATTAGTYGLTITGTAASGAHSAGFTLTVTAAGARR